MSHRHEDYGDFSHFIISHDSTITTLSCLLCDPSEVMEWQEQPVVLADIVKTASQHEVEMDRHEHRWVKRSSMGDPYETCLFCGVVRDDE